MGRRSHSLIIAMNTEDFGQMGKASRGKSTEKTGGPSAQKADDVIDTQYPKWWIALAIVMSVVITVINFFHLGILYENDRHFSHLADFEREMAHRTEMGLYFSYYKTIINAPSFAAGVYEITHDNVTEFGHEINTLKRFNLYPEVFLSFAYRNYKWIASVMNWKIENCWQVNRGEGLAPVESCEGMGNSHYFYINHAFSLAATVLASVFLLGILVSDSIFGGLIAVACFAFNFREATRVQWSPPLRESFGFPMIIAQILLVTYILKNRKTGLRWSLSMSFFTVNAMLFWQFSQFAFFTQIGSLFVVYAFDFVPLTTIKTLVFGHLISFAISFGMLFGNEMLLAGIYFPSIVSLLVILLGEPVMNKIQFRPLYLIVSFVLFITMTIGLKIGIAKTLQIEDDAHIIDILRSKFSDFATFHTRLYTCSAEFDFVQLETLKSLSYTLLLPSAVAGFLLFSAKLAKDEYKNILWRDGVKGKEHAEVFYNCVQAVCYIVMASLIMRLKLFSSPHLCVLAAILANNKLITGLGLRLDKRLHIALLVVLIAAMGHEGKSNIEKALAIRGEYSNPDQEHLFDWINKNTNKDAVFAGTMPVMANVKLSTGRPIVNHPHYEDVGIRERTLKVYSMFSKKPLSEVHQTLTNMGVNYFVFQLFNCAPDQKRPHCAYRGMWDEEDPVNSGRPSNCDLFHESINQKKPELIEPFHIVYNLRKNYIVVKV